MKEKNIGIQFLEQSSYAHMEKPDQQKGIDQPPLEMPYEGEAIKLIELNQINLPDIDLKSAIFNRISIRKYPDLPISMEELSYVLYMTQGVKTVKENRVTLRTVPSAGARHPFETYILVNHVTALEKGLYRYIALSHQLIKVDMSHDIAQKITDASSNQMMIKEASITLIWVADAYRAVYRYGQRGYRYIMLDAGHVCQNVYLIAQQLKCGTCAIAAFDDQALNQVMKLDGENQFVTYLATFGKL